MAALQLVGSFVSAFGQIKQGQAENQAAQIEAAQLDARGREEFAAAQRDAMAKRQEGTLANSTALATAAASGGGADSSTIVKLMSDIASQAEYNAQTVMYGGKSRRAGLFAQAAARRRSGHADETGSFLSAFGTLAGGFGKFANNGGFG